MVLDDVLKKLSGEEKRVLLVDIVILPAIQEDKSLSQEEKGDIFLAGKKLGFSHAEIETLLREHMAAVGAREE